MRHRGRKSQAEVDIVDFQERANRRDPYDEWPSSRSPSPPEHLSTRAKKFWRTVTAHNDLGPHQFEVLQAACEALDRKDTARQAIAEHGLSYVDERGMVRSRPEVQIERDARIAFLRAIRELRLDVDPPKAKAKNEPPGWFIDR